MSACGVDVENVGENEIGLDGREDVGEVVGEVDGRLYRALRGTCEAIRAASFQMSQ